MAKRPQFRVNASNNCCVRPDLLTTPAQRAVLEECGASYIPIYKSEALKMIEELVERRSAYCDDLMMDAYDDYTWGRD